MTSEFEMAMERLEELQYGWYSSLEELVEEIEEAGFSVDEASHEYISASYEDEDETVYIDIRLCGTERTIKVNSIEEIERM